MSFNTNDFIIDRYIKKRIWGNNIIIDSGFCKRKSGAVYHNYLSLGIFFPVNPEVSPSYALGYSNLFWGNLRRICLQKYLNNGIIIKKYYIDFQYLMCVICTFIAGKRSLFYSSANSSFCLAGFSVCTHSIWSLLA